MKIEIEIDEAVIDKAVREDVATAIRKMAQRFVAKQMLKFEGPIEKAVEQFLDKELTPEKLKGLVDTEVLQAIKDRLS